MLSKKEYYILDICSTRRFQLGLKTERYNSALH